MEIIFYSTQNKEYILEVSDSFYKWLALSEFSKIQTSEKYTIVLDGEEIEIEAVTLDEKNRNSYIQFFQTCILTETYQLIQKTLFNNNFPLL